MNKKIMALILAGIVLPFTGLADDWLAKRNILYREIDDKIEEEVAKQCAPEIIARANGIPYPIKQVTQPLEMLYAEARKEATEQADKIYTKEKEDAIAIETMKQHSQFQLGEKITILLVAKDGREISGKLHDFNRNTVHIGTRWIKMGDIDLESQKRFFEDTCAELQKRKMTMARKKYQNQKEDYIEMTLKQTLPQKLFDSGFYPKNSDISKSGYMKISNWTSLQELFDEKKQEAEEEAEEKIRPEITNKIMTKNGFVFDGIQKEWIPGQNYREDTPIYTGDEPKQNIPNVQTQEPERTGFFGKIRKIFD